DRFPVAEMPYVVCACLLEGDDATRAGCRREAVAAETALARIENLPAEFLAERDAAQQHAALKEVVRGGLDAAGLARGGARKYVANGERTREDGDFAGADHLHRDNAPGAGGKRDNVASLGLRQLARAVLGCLEADDEIGERRVEPGAGVAFVPEP